VNSHLLENHFISQLGIKKKKIFEDNYLGQKSYPILNRLGYSMYWDSMWDNIKLFSLMWRKNKIVSDYVKGFISDKYFQKFQFIKGRNKIDLRSSIFSNKYKLFFLNPNDLSFSRSFKSNPMFTSKTWLFVYQRWVIVKIFLFFSTKKKFKNLLDQESIKTIKIKPTNNDIYYNWPNKRLDYSNYMFVLANFIKKDKPKNSLEKTFKIKYF